MTSAFHGSYPVPALLLSLLLSACSIDIGLHTKKSSYSSLSQAVDLTFSDCTASTSPYAVSSTCMEGYHISSASDPAQPAMNITLDSINNEATVDVKAAFTCTAGKNITIQAYSYMNPLDVSQGLDSISLYSQSITCPSSGSSTAEFTTPTSACKFDSSSAAINCLIKLKIQQDDGEDDEEVFMQSGAFI